MVQDLIKELASIFKLEESSIVKYNESLALHSTFRIGGPADVFIRLADPYAIAWLYGKAKQNDIPFLIIGNGSNIIFDDAGFRGIVLSTSALNRCDCNGFSITCDAGVSLNYLSQIAKKNSLSGLEFAYGIPGSVGGAVYMNAGAYGGEMSQVVTSSLVMSFLTGELTEVSRLEHEYGYRESRFMHTHEVILSSTFQLLKGKEDEINEMMNQNMIKRMDKQPLDFPSAGSVFKRPEGNFAGKLIEEAHLKGFTIGDAQVSEKHAGFIINLGHATSNDVKNLILEVQNRVLASSDILLEPEVRIIGEKG